MAQALTQQSAPQSAKGGVAKGEFPSAALERKALEHYDLSLSPSTPSELTVAHRHQAKTAAQHLYKDKHYRAPALNLLARIALDEGFYDEAENRIREALLISPNDAGCWYSLGHIHLARHQLDEALQSFSTALDIAPDQTRAATSLAYTLACKGHVVEAFQAYRDLFKLHPNDEHIRAKLFELLPNIQADFYQSDLADDVVQWLNIPDANTQALAPLVMSLWRHKFQLDDDDAILDLQQIARDPLFTHALPALYFTQPDIEQFLGQVRKQVLLNCIQSHYQDEALMSLAAQFALQALVNEHVMGFDADEENLIKTLHPLLSKASPELAHLIVLYGMYEPIEDAISHFKVEPLSQWPTYAQPFIQRAILDPKREKQLAATISTFGDIHESVSLAVKDQYEQNPYPRWIDLGYNTPTNYGRALELQLPNFRAPDFFNMGTIKVLVAGCGTGRHALRVARYFRNVDVTAIDLSKRSLAYAKRKAEEYGIRNIRFLCGDLLEVSRLGERFHVIESSGVLHHMADPKQGLAALVNVLEPRGLIKLGLYSYAAREVVRTMRSLITEFEIPPEVVGIRMLRQAIMDNKMPYDVSGLLASEDFYSTSGCRDLLFHVQEVQYEPNDIEELLTSADLNFKGFVLSGAAKQAWHQVQGKNKTANPCDLSHWSVVEAHSPNIFAGMFQFYAQRPA